MKLRKRETAFGGGSVRKSNRGSFAAYAGIISYMIVLGIRIPISVVIGDAGIGLFAPAFELYTLTALFFTYGISRTMTGLIRYRMKREQYKNARKVFHTAVKISTLTALVIALVVVITSGFLAEDVFLEAMSRRALIAAAPAVVLAALISSLRGYFNGCGFGPLVAWSQYIEKTAMLIAGLIGGRISYEYGQKAAALLKNDSAASAYGAQGAIWGIVIAELITLIYLSVVFIFHTGTWKRQLMQDGGRRMESGGEITGMLIGNSIPMILVVLLSNLFMAVDQRFFNYCMNIKELGGTRTAGWGSYYGKYAVLTGIGAALVCLAVQWSIGRIASSYDRDEYRLMRERIGGAMKKLCIVAFPAAIYLAVLAESFITGLYLGEDSQAVSILRQGTVVILFYGAAWMFGQMMMKMRMIRELLFTLAAAFAVHILAAVLLVRNGHLGAEGILYSVILYTGVLAVLSFVLVGKRVGYKPELLYSVAFPAVSSAVSGLVILLLNKLLFGLLGALPTLLITCLIGTVIYMVLLILLHVINEGELLEMPLGRVWITIGRLFGVM